MNGNESTESTDAAEEAPPEPIKLEPVIFDSVLGSGAPDTGSNEDKE